MIRRLRDDEVDELIEVWLAATILGQDFLPEEHWRAEEPLVREELLPLAETWVVVEEGSLVAFVSLLGPTIGGLFTHPHHQGKGHGRALFDHVAARHDELFIEVFERNEKAMSIYRRWGFVDHERDTDPGSGLEMAILRLDR